MFAGVDEAGRGPVLGPLVVAAVGLPEGTDLPEGVGDSKALTAARRTTLARAVVNALPTAVIVLPPEEIDQAVARNRLNGLEHAAYGLALEDLGATRAVVDTVGPPGTCAAEVRRWARRGDLAVEARKGADASEPLVGAASIVAKVVRDVHIEALGRRLDRTVGSGYPSDPRTRAFLGEWYDEHGDWPPGTRRSWATLEALRPRAHQQGLDAWAVVPGRGPGDQGDH